MLGLENPIHLAFLLILLLLVFGAKRLPEMGRSLGSGLRGFKDSLGGDEEPALDARVTTAAAAAPPEPASPVPAPSSIPASDQLVAEHDVPAAAAERATPLAV